MVTAVEVVVGVEIVHAVVGVANTVAVVLEAVEVMVGVVLGVAAVVALEVDTVEAVVGVVVEAVVGAAVTVAVVLEAVEIVVGAVVGVAAVVVLEVDTVEIVLGVVLEDKYVSSPHQNPLSPSNYTNTHIHQKRNLHHRPHDYSKTKLLTMMMK